MGLKALMQVGQNMSTFQWRLRHRLPVVSHRTEYPWGKHKQEDIDLPTGAFLMLSDLLNGRYDAWFPKLVWLPIRGFYLPQRSGGSWYHLHPKQRIECVVLSCAGERRLYWVMLVPNPQIVSLAVWPKVQYYYI